MKLAHIGVPVKDLNLSKVFYDAIASIVDLEIMDVHDDFAGYGDGDSYRFYIHTGKEAISGLHLCFEVDTKEKVDSFYEVALSSRGSGNGAPGIRQQYNSNYYAAFVIDPDGNNIETVCYLNKEPVSPEELTEKVTPQNRHDETDWGPDVGREIVD